MKVFPLFGGQGWVLIKLTLLTVGLDNITRKLLTNFETNKLRTEQVTEFHVKKNTKFDVKKRFFPYLGGKDGSDQTDTTYSGAR